MTDARPPDDSFHAPGPPDEEGPYCEEIQHSQVSALVPERVSRGVFSTGAVVVQGAHEFILDFLLRMSQPQQVAARVVLPPGVVAQFIAALTDNLNNYQSKFGQRSSDRPDCSRAAPPRRAAGRTAARGSPVARFGTGSLRATQAPGRRPFRQLRQCRDDRSHALRVLFRFHHNLLSALGRFVPRLHGGSGRPAAARLAQTLFREISAEGAAAAKKSAPRPRST